MKQKNLIIIGVVIVIVIGLISTLVLGNKKTSTQKNTTQDELSMDVIPTVDASVKVDLIGDANKRKVTLSVNGLPSGTTSLDYSLSYETEAQGSQGIIGDGIKIENNQKEYEVTRELGTCSSGSCVYHDVVGKINVEIKFTGSYGEKMFQKEFDF